MVVEEAPIQIARVNLVDLVVVEVLMDDLLETVLAVLSQEVRPMLHLLLVGVVMVLVMAVDQDLLVEAVEPYRLEYSIKLLVVKVVMECNCHQISAIQLQV